MQEIHNTSLLDFFEAEEMMGFCSIEIILLAKLWNWCLYFSNDIAPSLAWIVAAEFVLKDS